MKNTNKIVVANQTANANFCCLTMVTIDDDESGCCRHRCNVDALYSRRHLTPKNAVCTLEWLYVWMMRRALAYSNIKMPIQPSIKILSISGSRTSAQYARRIFAEFRQSTHTHTHVDVALIMRGYLWQLQRPHRASLQLKRNGISKQKKNHKFIRKKKWQHKNDWLCW